ncbi:MAG: D-alanine--D-alanine ligase [Firmicutes bacterium]|nr:D-alanine--D-alanine ligase [Bacillota bacterium]
MIKIGVIFGGRSGEHDISLMSAASVIRALDRTKFEPLFFGITRTGEWKHFEGSPDDIENGKWEETAKPFNIGNLKEMIDFALPILHGPYGEDGTVQGMFEILDIPYGGCGVLASAAAMDKGIAKDIFAKAGLPICKHALVFAEDMCVEVEADEALEASVDVEKTATSTEIDADASAKSDADAKYEADVQYEESDAKIGESDARAKCSATEGMDAKSGVVGTARARRFDDGMLATMAAQIEEQVPYPMFVKPANMGSSVGINKAKDRDSLISALKEAAHYDRRIVVEQGINCRELETGVIGNHFPEAAAVGEIKSSDEFYDYDAKYVDGHSQMCIPADISEDIREEIRSLAIKAYMAIDCAGFARVDFFLEKETNKVYINEINTIPGFTRFSMFPGLWAEAGVPYSELIERIVEFGYERHNAKNSR